MMQLEVGKLYITREARLVKITADLGKDYSERFIGEFTEGYCSHSNWCGNGSFIKGEYSPLDLVSEINEVGHILFG